MKTIIILLALAAGCTNDAISYAKMIDPRVKCNAVRTEATGNDDTAVCFLRTGRGPTQVWACAAEGPNGFPVCNVAATYNPEAQ